MSMTYTVRDTAAGDHQHGMDVDDLRTFVETIRDEELPFLRPADQRRFIDALDALARGDVDAAMSYLADLSIDVTPEGGDDK